MNETPSIDRTFLCVLPAFISFCCLICSCNQRDPPANNKITILPSTQHVLPDPGGVAIDKSPMDMAYYPVDYPKEKMVKTTNEQLIARLIYSRPKKDKRIIFGDVIKYGSPWRLGANEATEIEFFKNVTIQNQKIAQGRYVLYCIPYPDKWRLILNNDLFTWGLKFDSTRDVYQFTVPVQKSDVPFERFTMEFEKASTGMQLHIAWDSLHADVPILF